MLYIVGVKFNNTNSENIYYYNCLDKSISVGDYIVVPTNEDYKDAKVVCSGEYAENDLPYPLKQLKTVIGKSFNKFNNNTKEIIDLNYNSEYTTKKFFDKNLSELIKPYCVIENGILKYIKKCDFKKIIIPEGIHTIEGFSYYKVSKGEDAEIFLDSNSYDEHFLEELFIPASVKKIELEVNRNYDGLINLRKLYLSDGVEEINDNCFYDSEISELFIPKSIKKLGNASFNWHRIEKVWLDSNNQYYEIKNGCLFSKDGCLCWISPILTKIIIDRDIIDYNSIFSEKVNEIIIKNGVKVFNCKCLGNVKKIIIPKSLKELLYAKDKLNNVEEIK